ncbi:GNAT family N-acetyltransferase [Streptomyces sp. TRM68367]|uniref:GNAT family N-acetyltransferase n=1 Tax=Streptomyces sp. TRM68367 TaxID=2758415 RepID=UPI00165C5F6E|nr:GNAT family N-acetyltransferase [Streptomyces sp. TRM68367]MBC9724395.1 hypothetical protein [Streptomyces sp. TRM68367]
MQPSRVTTSVRHDRRPSRDRSDRSRPAEIVLLDSRDEVVGRLRYRVCADCRTGRILDVWISDPWQREGLGREALHTLLSIHPGRRWSTTLQSAPGRAFFTAMAEETDTDFPAAGPLCPHLRGWARRLAHRAIGLASKR